MLLQLLLSAQDKIYHANHPRKIVMILDLATALKDARNPDKARQLLVLARQIYEQRYGDKSVPFADISDALAGMDMMLAADES